jgi:hypothetical protein
MAAYLLASFPTNMVSQMALNLKAQGEEIPNQETTSEVAKIVISPRTRVTHLMMLDLKGEMSSHTAALEGAKMITLATALEVV